MHRTSGARRLAALTATLAAAAVAVPATADAAYTSAVSGATVTLTGNDDPDVLTIGEAGGLLTFAVGAGAASPDFDTATPGDQTVPADGTVTVNVAAAGGDDAIAVATVNVAAGSTFDAGRATTRSPAAIRPTTSAAATA